MAVKKGDLTAINLLLGHGADPGARCVGDAGETILEFAEKQGKIHPIILHLLKTNKRPRS
jgi:hypothetical protein